MSGTHRVRFLNMIGIAILSLSPMLCAAQIYKCVENGSTTFQSEPCKSGGTLMHLDTRPSAVDDEAARIHAENIRKASEQSALDWKERKKREDAIKVPDCEKLNKAVADSDAQRKQLTMGIGNPGTTDAGIRNVNRLMGPVNQQYNNAKVMADASGCQ